MIACEEKKIILGQFFTKEMLWLKPQILEFICSKKCDIAYDPFAGAGHLLKSAKKIGFEETIGLDIDSKLGWKTNDSLISIPHVNDKTMIITNPPYLSNYSASRKKIMDKVEKYFNTTKYNNLYLLALERMLDAQELVVAIIPETFINSNFQQKNLLHSITILEENPFDDTDTPIVVACFDGIYKDLSKVKVFKNDRLINDLNSIENLRLSPLNTIKMKFNSPNGWLAIRCVDTTNPKNMLRFDFKENIKYNWDKRIKDSSRLLTLVDINISDANKTSFINECNKILRKLRTDSGDIILSPFKGNMRNGTRRRRLDFKTCRAIIEKAYNNTIGEKQHG